MYVKWFTDVDKNALDQAGGKGANLGELARAGFPVPHGFVVTTNAYRAFVERSQLQDEIRQALSRLQDGDPAALEAAEKEIAAAFRIQEIPPDIADAIREAYERLSSGRGLAVAVRSSATAEDLPGASFAGQQESYLNVSGPEALLNATQRCWASLWTGRAIGYRARQGISPEGVSLAVVVQEMAPAEVAGILFTANPMTGARDEVVIDAAWGLGESIVGGQVTPDNFVADKDTGRVKEMTIAEKGLMTVSAVVGTEARRVDVNRRRAATLDGEQVGRLVELGRAIEAHYGVPQDIEWCIAGDQLSVVQARPITALPPEPVCWESPGEGVWVHGGGGIMELIVEPISPLAETLVASVILDKVHEFATRCGIADMFAWPMVQFVNGFAYTRIEMRPRPRHIPALIRTLRAHQRSLADWPDMLARYRRAVADLGQAEATELSPEALHTRVEALLEVAGEYWNNVGLVIRAVIDREARFARYYDRYIRRKGDPVPEVLTRGEEMRALQAERSVYALAERARALPRLVRALAEAEDPLAACQSHADARPFVEALETHLDTYGHLVFSLDPRHPILAEDPRPVLVAVRAYLEGQESPDTRQRRMTREQQAALAAIEARVLPCVFRKLSERLSAAREAARVREDAMFEFGLAWRPLRRYLLELGRRLVKAGMLWEAGDVFWLTGEELERAAAALDAGQPATSLRQTLSERRAAWKRCEDLQPPTLLPVGSKSRFWWKHIMPVPTLQEQKGETLQGLGVSPGKVTAVARVVTSPAEVGRLNPGEILVTHTTTPAWTPAFARISALVTDLGGPLAHGSIVAREYGIPAVMGTGVATRRTRDGQKITVDGSAGRVYLNHISS